MSRKVFIPVLVAVLVAAAVTIGVLATRAQGSSTLPSVTASQLLADVATKANDTKSMSGDVTWKNSLIGDTSALNLGGASTPTGLASLLQGGSGRIWLQGGQVRLESQGQGGDLVVTAANGSVWTYSSATDTATEYTLPSGADAEASPTPTPSSTLDPTTQIETMLQKLAPTAAVAVTGQENVAGQQSYILTLTPTASDTTVGSVQVAIDGTTFVPLRIEVFPKGSTAAAISGGFTSVSYDTIDAKLFEFAPPEGATVVHKAVPLPAELGAQQGGQEPAVKEHKPLTLEQAKAQAGFDLALPSDTSLPFTGAMIIPAEQGGPMTSPVVVLHYGSGFGSVVLVETRATADQVGQLQKQLDQLSKVQIVQATIVGGDPGLQLSTSLFNLLAWQHGQLTVVAAGMVPQSELSAFAGSVS